ncbi:hypothetical protein C8J57DRAFT_1713060 [Mycena rebaudengoi]|nr:hypothetical protein C8J57DRAFT_1713060 [Mycena rebaudengoi]
MPASRSHPPKQRTTIVIETIGGAPVFHIPVPLNIVSRAPPGGAVKFVFRNIGGTPTFHVGGAEVGVGDEDAWDLGRVVRAVGERRVKIEEEEQRLWIDSGNGGAGSGDVRVWVKEEEGEQPLPPPHPLTAEERLAFARASLTSSNFPAVFYDGRREFALECAPALPADRALSAREEKEYDRLWDALLRMERVAGAQMDVDTLRQRTGEMMSEAVARVHAALDVGGSSTSNSNSNSTSNSSGSGSGSRMHPHTTTPAPDGGAQDVVANTMQELVDIDSAADDVLQSMAQEVADSVTRDVVDLVGRDMEARDLVGVATRDRVDVAAQLAGKGAAAPDMGIPKPDLGITTRDMSNGIAGQDVVDLVRTGLGSLRAALVAASTSNSNSNSTSHSASTSIASSPSTAAVARRTRARARGADVQHQSHARTALASGSGSGGIGAAVGDNTTDARRDSGHEQGRHEQRRRLGGGARWEVVDDGCAVPSAPNPSSAGRRLTMGDEVLVPFSALAAGHTPSTLAAAHAPSAPLAPVPGMIRRRSGAGRRGGRHRYGAGRTPDRSGASSAGRESAGAGRSLAPECAGVCSVVRWGSYRRGERESRRTVTGTGGALHAMHGMPALRACGTCRSFARPRLAGGRRTTCFDAHIL